MSRFFGGKDPFDDPFFTQPHDERKPFDDPFFTHPFGHQHGMESWNGNKELIPKWMKENPSGGGGSSSYSRYGSYAYANQDGIQYSYSQGQMGGSDGFYLSEMREDDKRIKESQHRISKGIHNKGHSVATKTKDGKADSMQTLHNLNPDELPDFDTNWNTSAAKYFPGGGTSFNLLENEGQRSIGWDGYPKWFD